MENLKLNYSNPDPDFWVKWKMDQRMLQVGNKTEEPVFIPEGQEFQMGGGIFRWDLIDGRPNIQFVRPVENKIISGI